MTDNILVLEGLSKVLSSDAGEFELLVDRLALERGKFYALVGKSGSGKSTMLDLLSMVSFPTSVDRFEMISETGTVDLAGLIASGKDADISAVRRTKFSYILQSGGLFPFLTVRENLALPFQLRNAPVPPGYFERFAEQFDMVHQLDKKPSALSGGQRQRASILRALAGEPQMVLADEPTAAIDETMALIVVKEFRDLAARQGATVLMVSHDLDLVGRFADQIFTLKPHVVSPRLTRSELEAH
ncbi:ATP-binding cassette domain-containing protein [Aliihoeflea sp. 2WW]|uniref:ABC transporter ATP-binding protein n=1 Tax=Aliihoeflea sp. 2WW TaxID=1381123 RepID=UPI000463C87F|nr:ATP-binding cassette domain-containing protein [Aliihoeflea sp. 2WW]